MSFTGTTPFNGGTTDQHRHNLRRRLGVATLGAALLSAAAGVGTTSADSVRASAPPAAASETTVPLASSRPTAVRDEIVVVDGVGLHVRCTGSGDTTVVLIAGFEDGDEKWAVVEPEIAAGARVCSSARPGTGSSDPAGPTQTFTTQAAQLDALLAAIGEPGPYVVVGHSFEGAEAVTFAAGHPDEVVGLVLIDTSPANWPSELCSFRDGTSDFAAVVRTVCDAWTDPTTNTEHLDVFASFDELAGISSLGSLPITVITAVDRQFPGSTPDELARLTMAWNEGQQRWAELSTSSQVIPVENTGHDIQLEQPAVVIEAVLALLP